MTPESLAEIRTARVAARDGGGDPHETPAFEGRVSESDLAPVPGSLAFGAPGVSPTWSSSDKDYVTTALG
ncbi:MAG TPA: hypothetical protein VKP66_03350, partial [Steroidobacteraceae bacterium]|nr:hypothetical protein [Steroidobacteraceae bacterium]